MEILSSFIPQMPFKRPRNFASPAFGARFKRCGGRVCALDRTKCQAGGWLAFGPRKREWLRALTPRVWRGRKRERGKEGERRERGGRERGGREEGEREKGREREKREGEGEGERGREGKRNFGSFSIKMIPSFLTCAHLLFLRDVSLSLSINIAFIALPP